MLDLWHENKWRLVLILSLNRKFGEISGKSRDIQHKQIISRMKLYLLQLLIGQESAWLFIKIIGEKFILIMTNEINIY